MNKTVLSTVLSASALALAPSAFAQNCPPGSWLCADVQVNTGINAGVTVGAPVAPVIVQQAPPVVVYQPPPPPPPPVVVYQPPPPPVYVQPAPPPSVVVTATPSYTVTTETTYTWIGLGRRQAVGLGGHIGGLLMPARDDGTEMGRMGGFGASLRFRTHPWLGTELSLDYFGGRDYNGDLRGEVPFTASELFYLNPMNRFQVYLLAGLGGSLATVQYQNSSLHGGMDSDNYGYLGGQAGVGAEWQLTPNFSLYADLRAFLRARVDHHADVNPEFQRVTASGHTQTSNTSSGAFVTLGAMFYF